MNLGEIMLSYKCLCNTVYQYLNTKSCDAQSIKVTLRKFQSLQAFTVFLVYGHQCIALNCYWQSTRKFYQSTSK